MRLLFECLALMLWALLCLAVLTSLVGIMAEVAVRNGIERLWRRIFSGPSSSPTISLVRTGKWPRLPRQRSG